MTDLGATKGFSVCLFAKSERKGERERKIFVDSQLLTRKHAQISRLFLNSEVESFTDKSQLMTAAFKSRPSQAWQQHTRNSAFGR